MLTRVKKYLSNSTTILFGLMVLLSSCEASIEEIQKVNSKEVNLDNVISGLDLVHTDSGVVKLRVKAPIAITHADKEEPYREFPNGLEVFFFKDRDTIIENYLVADYGINYTNKKFSEVRGNVVVINNQGDTLRTEKMFWNNKERKIFSDELVRISQADQIIIGKNGFEADESFSYYKILNSSGDIKIDEE
jgi:LPS export ABC transporter protein LptC